MTASPERIVILADGQLTFGDAKTAFGVIRYGTDHVVALIDRANAGNNPFQGDPQLAAASEVVARPETQPEAQASLKPAKEHDPMPNPMLGSLREDNAASLGRPPPAESNI